MKRKVNCTETNSPVTKRPKLASDKDEAATTPISKTSATTSNSRAIAQAANKTPVGKATKGRVVSVSTPTTVKARDVAGLPAAEEIPKLNLSRSKDSTKTKKAIPGSSKLKGILRNDSGTASPARSVSFELTSSIRPTLEKMREQTATKQECDDMLAHIVESKGRGLALCIEELRKYVSLFDREQSPIMQQIIQIPVINKEPDVFSSFQRLLLSLAGQHPFYSKIIIKSMLRQLMPSKQAENPEIFSYAATQNVHLFLKKFLSKFDREKKEMVKLVANVFPFFKLSAEKLASYCYGVLRIYSYLPEKRSELLEMVVEKCIQLDASITRAHIRSFAAKLNRDRKERVGDDSDADDGKVQEEKEEDASDDEEEEDEEELVLDPLDERLCENLDKFLEVVFEFLRDQTCEKQEVKPADQTGEETINSEKGGTVESLSDEPDNGQSKTTTPVYTYIPDKPETDELERLLLDIFPNYLLTTNKLGHVQFIYFYLASSNKSFAKRFLDMNWKTFTAVNNASFIRQSAMTHISGFLCRSLVSNEKMVKKWLTKIVNWMHNYLSKDITQDVDYVVVNLTANGSFYSACLAAFYIISFCHRELVSGSDVSFLRNLKLDRIISHPLNPLRVISSSLLKVFSKVLAYYQVVYCNNIIQRNKRISLPVVGLTSNGCVEGKPLLLDDFYPYDPYLLPTTTHFIKPLYREYQPFEEIESDNEDSDEDQELDFNLDITDMKEKRGDTSSNRSRTRTISLTDVISQELDMI